MNFINKAKATANKINSQETTGTHTPPLPGKKPPLPGKKPPIPGKKPPVGAPPSKKPINTVHEEENSVKGPLEKKANPFIKVNKKESPEIAPVIEEKVDSKEPIKKIVEEATKEIKKEPIQEVNEEIIEENEEVIEEKTKKKSSKKKSSKKTKANEDNNDDSDDVLEISKTTTNYENALAFIKSGFIDKEWEEFRTETSETINSINISNEMTTIMIKSTLSDLSLLRDSIWRQYNDTKTNYEILTSKEPEGTIERRKRIAAKGANAEERKLNGILAVMNSKDSDGNTINLYELLDETRDRYNYLKALMDAISYKNSVLITMLGSLKLEK